VPLASRFAWGGQLFVVSDVFAPWYGVRPYRYTIRDGEARFNFALPEMKEALRFYKQMYEEGILDQEFATTEGGVFWGKVAEQNVAVLTNDTDQLIPGYNVTDERIYRYAPPLDEYPDVLTDEKYTWGFDIFPIAGHRTAIAASSKLPDRAWDVLEGFASDELWDVIAWGREGKEYIVENGQRVPTDRLYSGPEDDPADSHRWTLHLGIISGFWPTQTKYEVARLRNPELFDAALESAQWTMERARENGLYFMDFMPVTDEIARKSGEINPFISSVMAQVIMGEMSFNEYDEKIAEFEREFGFITDYYTEYVNEHRDELRAKNVKMVDW